MDTGLDLLQGVLLLQNPVQERKHFLKKYCWNVWLGEASHGEPLVQITELEGPECDSVCSMQVLAWAR